MTVTEPIHLMGPNGEIIATLCPFNDGKGIALHFDYEKVEVKSYGIKPQLHESDYPLITASLSCTK